MDKRSAPTFGRASGSVPPTGSALSPAARASGANETRRAARVVHAIVRHYRRLARAPSPKRESLRLVAGTGPRKVEALLAALSEPWSDYAIACVYAILMSPRRRKALGVYLTPPHLVTHLVRRMEEFGLDLGKHRLQDPAAGGAAFVVPLAREMTRRWRAAGDGSRVVLERLKQRLRGRELDEGLAAVANALVRRMLTREFDFPRQLVEEVSLVDTANSLTEPEATSVDHEVGNPPYLRLGAQAHLRWKGPFADIAHGRLNLYAMFVRRALRDVPPGGLVGHVVPASFLAGPEFAHFRKRVLQLAEVLVVDAVAQRTNVFLDVIQDTCFVVLRRRATTLLQPPSGVAQSVVFESGGVFGVNEEMEIPPDGAAWTLPGVAPNGASATLVDYGYRARVGHLVANREPKRLFRRAGKGRVALVWAKCVTPTGRFDFERGRTTPQAGGRGYVSVPTGAPYVVRTPCVLVQRTSSTNQRQRLHAAAVPLKFLRERGGLVGENHVILLERLRSDAVAPSVLVEVLNGPAANRALARLCRSASISVRLLETLPLPRPPASATRRRRG